MAKQAPRLTANVGQRTQKGTLVTQQIKDAADADWAGVLEIEEDNARQIADAIDQALAKALEEVGLVAEGYAKKACPGIIPACAGNTLGAMLYRPPPRDHPRVCGEHEGMQDDGYKAKGSSPRVRGTRYALRAARLGQGIIPACAGNTRGGPSSGEAGRDHPRVCGEHWPSITSSAICSGSSPRVRGTRVEEGCVDRRPGIIPACAGNTRAPCPGISK